MTQNPHLPFFSRLSTHSSTACVSNVGRKMGVGKQIQIKPLELDVYSFASHFSPLLHYGLSAPLFSCCSIRVALFVVQYCSPSDYQTRQYHNSVASHIARSHWWR